MFPSDVRPLNVEHQQRATAGVKMVAVKEDMPPAHKRRTDIGVKEQEQVISTNSRGNHCEDHHNWQSDE
ncbi:hypothetical protein CVT26_014315 [Gymnopilus dilepis]|uniref:Uncharacterized protein n=1 Tax=Gymnopilus dilepis TaxID=231916 RepID=A0A409Y7K4_9AGAR|nr:hypothetical protein CVT26_014315 [Gymnopilus dilepis]